MTRKFIDKIAKQREIIQMINSSVTHCEQLNAINRIDIVRWFNGIPDKNKYESIFGVLYRISAYMNPPIYARMPEIDEKFFDEFELLKSEIASLKTEK